MAGDGIEMIFSGMEEFRKALDEMVAKADAGSREIVTKGALIIENNAKRHAHVISGRLRRSIRLIDVTSLGFGVWKSRVAPTVIYGRIQELGGTIRPKGDNATGLLWFKVGGQLRSAKSVTLKPHPYLKPGVDDSHGELSALAESVWAKAAG